MARAPDAAARRSGQWVSANRFEHHLAALEEAGYRGVTLDDVWRAWHDGDSLPRRPVVLSFDDGYADHARNAAPLLSARNWPGVLNLVTSRLDADGGLEHEEVLGLVAEGWEIGAHTLTHPDLTRLRGSRLRKEVAGSRAILRRALGVPVDTFCYPYGRSGARVRAVVRQAGYKTATTIRRGVARPSGDPLALPRLTVGGRMSSRSLLQLVRSGTTNGLPRARP